MYRPAQCRHLYNGEQGEDHTTGLIKEEAWDGRRELEESDPEREGMTLAPNDGFLIHQIVDHLDAVPQLELRPLRHG